MPLNLRQNSRFIFNIQVFLLNHMQHLSDFLEYKGYNFEYKERVCSKTLYTEFISK